MYIPDQVRYVSNVEESVKGKKGEKIKSQVRTYMHVLRDFFLLQRRLRVDGLYIRVALQKPMADDFVLLPNYCKAAEKLLDIIIIIIL